MINLGDKAKPITAEDIIRRYNLENLKTDRKKLVQLKNALDKQYNIIKDFIIYISPYKNQTDKMSVWFLSGVPTEENEPFLEFTEVDKENSHLYYDKDTGKIYALLNGSWQELEDDNLKLSLAIANSESDCCDGKRNILFLFLQRLIKLEMSG